MEQRIIPVIQFDESFRSGVIYGKNGFIVDRLFGVQLFKQIAVQVNIVFFIYVFLGWSGFVNFKMCKFFDKIFFPTDKFEVNDSVGVPAAHPRIRMFPI